MTIATTETDGCTHSDAVLLQMHPAPSISPPFPPLASLACRVNHLSSPETVDSSSFSRDGVQDAKAKGDTVDYRCDLWKKGRRPNEICCGTVPRREEGERTKRERKKGRPKGGSCQSTECTPVAIHARARTRTRVYEHDLHAKPCSALPTLATISAQRATISTRRYAGRRRGQGGGR